MVDTQYEDTILSSSGVDENELFKFCFVRKDEGMTNEMKLAFEATKERFSDPESTVIMTNEECLNQPKSSLKEKRKYYIFDDFDETNEAFKYVSDVKTVYLLGTRAILAILLEHIKTTSGSFQIHNLSMRNLIITSTNLDKTKKLRMRQLVSYMGGHYIDALKDGCTHLISESVTSVKYEVATASKVKIMHPNWVEKVWEKSQTANNISANDDEYDCFKLPCFNGLCFTSTGLTSKDRDQLKSLVEENGGTYSASFNNSVAILLMEESSVGSIKHLHAIRLKKLSLTPAWVYESVEKGFALCISNYQFAGEKPKEKLPIAAKPNKVSTPTKSDMTINKFYPDSTMLSDISRITTYNCSSIDETMVPTTSKVDPPSMPKNLANQISIQAAKKVGNILDGYCFFMKGFSADELQLIGKVIGVLGATKVDSHGHQASHVLVGDVNVELFQDLAKVDNELPIVKVEWIKKMIEVKKFVSEEAYIVEQPVRKNVALANPSPASKKAIMSLSGTFKKPAIPKFSLEENVEVEENVQMVNQYLNPSIVSDSSLNQSSIVKILTGKNVFVYGCSSTEESMGIISKVEELGATLVDATFNHTVDFIITPNVLASQLDHGISKFKHLVNMLWLVECAEAGIIIDVQFYHKPLVEYTFGSAELPLSNEKIVVTNYKGNGRTHIQSLVTALGGEYTETLRKSDDAILISPDCEGRKCLCARDWNFTILKAEWLVECYERRRRVNETPFLLGGTKASKKNIESDDSIVLSSQDVVPHSHSVRNEDVDPVIENFDDYDYQTTPKVNKAIERLRNEEVGSPNLPSSPGMSDLSLIIQSMPTPVREVTKAVLAEVRAENAGSPRRKRYQEIFSTPGNTNKSIDNARLETPELLKAPAGDWAIRPNASPDSQWHHKRKMEALDQNYIPLIKKSKFEEEKEETPPPFSHRRYMLFKAIVPGYNSPDPRPSNSKKVESPSEATKFLNFEDESEFAKEQETEDDHAVEDNETLRELENQPKHQAIQELPKQKKIVHRFEPSSHQSDVYPVESEALVEWNYTQQAEMKANALANISPFNFETNALSPEEKSFVVEELSKFGCKHDPDNYSHLILKKPNRGEKYLSTMAAGGFSIHPEYVTQCAEAGRLVEIDPFEFGNPKFKSSLKEVFEEDIETMFNAPYKWRKWIKDEEIERFKDGAFTGMTFTIVEHKGKPTLFPKVLKKGGGNCVDIDFDKDLTVSTLKKMNIDCCLVENRERLSKRNAMVLQACNIRTVNVKFISDFLFSEEAPSFISQL